MGKDSRVLGAGFSTTQQPAIRFLVESALRRVKTTKETDAPRDRSEWVTHLCEALISDSETSHKAVLASLLANGVSSDDMFDVYIPAAARQLGEWWVKDRVSFVDVTVGAARLQSLYRGRSDGAAIGLNHAIPLGQSVLMSIPDFENHSLGAFAAADQFRRHGLWVHMGIGLKRHEMADLVRSGSFSIIGVSAATSNTLEKVTELVDYLRSNLDQAPPIVIGGRAVKDVAEITKRTGADFAVRSAREAVEKCGLSTVASSFTSEELT